MEVNVIPTFVNPDPVFCHESIDIKTRAIAVRYKVFFILIYKRYRNPVPAFNY